MKIKFLTEEEFSKLPKEKQTCCVKYSNCKAWYKEGKLHREDGPAVESNGNKFWYKEGKCHREDGPALEYTNGNKYWYKEGKLHRLDGPAEEYANGEIQYWLNNKYYSYTEWYAIVNKLEKFI